MSSLHIDYIVDALRELSYISNSEVIEYLDKHNIDYDDCTNSYADILLTYVFDLQQRGVSYLDERDGVS